MNAYCKQVVILEDEFQGFFYSFYRGLPVDYLRQRITTLGAFMEQTAAVTTI